MQIPEYVLRGPVCESSEVGQVLASLVCNPTRVLASAVKHTHLHTHTHTLPRPKSLAQDVNRYKLLNLADRHLSSEGLNTAQYEILIVTKEKLFTRIWFDVEETLYAKQAIETDQLHDELYGSLNAYWGELDYIPPPYWWNDPEVAARVRKQPKAERIRASRSTPAAFKMSKGEALEKRRKLVEKVKKQSPVLSWMMGW